MKSVSSTGKRILLVEDDPESASAISRLLTLLGAEALAVSDGESAVEQFPIFRPSMMIIDIGLPGISGIDVARMVRRQVTSAQPYLVALTGWGQSDDIRRSLEAGFDKHLVKPVELDQFKRLVKDY